MLFGLACGCDGPPVGLCRYPVILVAPCSGDLIARQEFTGYSASV